MRFDTHTIKTPTWTRDDYGDPKAVLGSPGIVHMKIGWNAKTGINQDGARYQQYDLVGLTREKVPKGSEIDGKYTVMDVVPGRINRVFMNYVEGFDRTYVEQQQGNNSESGIGEEHGS